MKTWEQTYIEFVISLAEPVKDGKMIHGWSVYWLMPCRDVEYRSKSPSDVKFVRNRPMPKI